MAEKLLQVQNLKKYFLTKRSKVPIKAVDGVSFSLGRGETLGIVGESGCGKSTLGRTIMGLYKPTDGIVLVEDKDPSAVKGKELLALRQRYQMIFQDPYSSLNPRLNVFDLIAEPLRTHSIAKSSGELAGLIRDLMERVGLSPTMAKRYPHEFSGGQRQRIAIARGIALKPQILICDEPVSALDVSIQAQIINLLHDLQRQLGLALLFISHDIALVRHLSHRILVMYLGKVVEIAPTTDLFAQPHHPYTQALLSAVPVPDPRVERRRQRVILAGEVGRQECQEGCVFSGRCLYAFAPCTSQEPRLRGEREEHLAACHLVAKQLG